jgi:hypothetical protein
MGTPVNRNGGAGQQSSGWLSGPGAVLILLGELVGVYLIFANALGPGSVATVTGTALVAGTLVGSFLLVLARQYAGRGAREQKSTVVRAAELTLSVTVLTLVTGIALVGGVVLALVAAFDGPDPQTTDGDRLRDRLLNWSDRNRQFIQANGRGDLPLEP